MSGTTRRAWIGHVIAAVAGVGVIGSTPLRLLADNPTALQPHLLGTVIVTTSIGLVEFRDVPFIQEGSTLTGIKELDSWCAMIITRCQTLLGTHIVQDEILEPILLAPGDTAQFAITVSLRG